ncbi:conserved hypothetical protein [Pyrenophora tritici-repentis Pt-1C-BFP]|uniref:Rhodopsin domain-containing protein n=1 Tax=Pyrenophora tritici-repentis (strain Pt-1C-BFP) TaxID=426418 RepID=B2WG39_PYRTR|nr:uncharacterized protein PTRG_08895 [Pyrenophora tritici-repentis Pt-1C-BFP]EDU41946.1 conserved hypothetical protein [Pyrenophora tritici-repentis Pt-1C-BFP]
MFGWDDIMMVIALALSIGTLGLFVKVIHLGLGRHAEAFPPENLYPFFKIMYFYSIMIIAAYSFIKLSIGFFLLRLADRTKWRPFMIGMLIFIGIFTIGSTFPIIFQCTPVRAGWDYKLRPPTGNAKCYSSQIFKSIGVFNSSINIATDLIFALVPIPMVWKLQVTIQTRIGLAVILGLGLFASAVAIYKTPMQYNFFKMTDWSGDGAWYYIWQEVEMYVGIIAACLPTLKPLFASTFGQMRSLATRGRSNSSNVIGNTPFRSNGYVKQSDSRSRTSYALKNMSERSQSTAPDPYGEDAVWGKDTYTVEASRGRNGTLACVRSQSEESEESILEQEGVVHGARMSVPMGMMIVRTTEVIIF